MSSAPDACPICADAGVKSLVETHRDPVGGKTYEILRCPACRVESARPFEHPGDGWYRAFVSADSYEGVDRGRYDRFFAAVPPGADVLLSPKKLLDVGCGAGQFLAAARERGFEAVGLDTNAEALEAARAKGVTDVFRGTLAEFRRSHPGASFDAVTLFDVLEHVDDPNELIGLAAGLLAPGGVVAITVPNARRPTLFGRDAFDQPPHHLTRWDAEALTAFLARHGLSVRRLDAAGLPTWDFSRHFIGRCTRAALGCAKRLVAGGAAAARDTTLTRLLAEGGPRAPGAQGLLAGAIGSKDARSRLVAAFETSLHCLTFPFFVWFKLYYTLARPGCGVTIFVVAGKC
ncbi:MAG: class I SAM-dependent methyltransferase [Elusimicrobia bacterium]|nr:class I SAM-dependent methyltransferase [Elusimicrobiota bacterium]